MKTPLTLTIGLSLAGALTAPSHAAGSLSEQDYFEALPVVLTVSRLEQPISDTPGAVTVLDRETIHRSGARDVADLLRLVPGYLVSGWNGANPNAMYHTPLDDYGTRNLVLIDGRSVYSPLLLGDTHHGLMSVLLEDIERIEVLRGSNSAAYGTNAMFGVINIVTRHTADTLGGAVSLTAGNQSVRDGYARIGWGHPEQATYRLSLGQQSDTGWRGLYDDRTMKQLHWRGDLRTSVDTDVLLEAGWSDLANGEGFPNSLGNPMRTNVWSDLYARGEWKRQLSDTEQVKASVSFDEEHYGDVAPVAGTDVALDYSGRGRRFNAEVQHQFQWMDGVRLVWGAGWKQDEARSMALYATDQAVKVHETRVFGNLEWRLYPQGLLNAGLFVGDHSHTGTFIAPRLMLNHQLSQDHTLRVGTTDAFRSPTLLELYGDVRRYSGGVQIGQEILAQGNAQPERLKTQEIGYFGNFRDWRLTLDVRAYRERMRDLIWNKTLTPYTPPDGFWDELNAPEDFVNLPGITARGVEYQLRWSPVEGTAFWLNQNWENYTWQETGRSKRVPPSHATTLALFQQLPGGAKLTLMWQALGPMAWRSSHEILPSSDRVDVHVAYPFQWGSTRAEAAVTVQALNGEQKEFLTAGRYAFERRAFVTLRLEY